MTCLGICPGQGPLPQSTPPNRTLAPILRTPPWAPSRALPPPWHPHSGTLKFENLENSEDSEIWLAGRTLTHTHAHVLANIEKEPRLIAGWLPSGHMTFCGWFTDEPHEPHERVPLG